MVAILWGFCVNPLMSSANSPNPINDKCQLTIELYQPR